MSHRQNTSADQKRKTRNDIILAAVIVVIAAAGLMLWRFNRAEGVSVAVNIDGVQTAVYPLAEDREVVITTGDKDEHRNVLVIEDGKAYIKEADCPDEICVQTRAAAYVGETIVCLPHKLVIEITAAGADPDLDMTV